MIGRKSELQYLENEYNRNGSSFVVIYGRRRIGKTTLIREFIKNKPSIYFLATEESESINQAVLRLQISDFIDSSLLRSSNADWETMIREFVSHDPAAKKILIIDEYQYLTYSNHAITSVFQRIWDLFLHDSQIMLILCGSFISMMIQETLAYKSPLYGRRTGQIRLRQMSLSEVSEMLPNTTQDYKMQVYAIAGGVTKYVEAFAQHADIWQSLRDNILNPGSLLYEEPNFLLAKEIGNGGVYFSILRAIASGEHKLGKICGLLGKSSSGITPYLSTLIEMDLVERRVPVTESNPAKSKKGLYFIKDNFFVFWFKYVYPYRSELEIGKVDLVIKRIQQSFVVNHMSYVYEEICLQHLQQMNGLSDSFGQYDSIAHWWDADNEIDLVGLDEENKVLLLVECKFEKSLTDISVLQTLADVKAKKVAWHNDRRQERFMIISHSGFTKALLAERDRRNDLTLLIF